MSVTVINMNDDDVVIVSVDGHVAERAKEIILEQYKLYFKNVIVQSSTTSVTVVNKKDLK